MKIIKLSFLIMSLVILIHCGGQGGTETGSTDFGPQALSQNFTTVAGRLIPEMESSGSENLNKFLDYGASSDWSILTNESNVVYLTDIFGGTEGVAPVTRIRVLLDQVATDMTNLINVDSDFSCTSNGQLNEGETITLPFFGELSNGSIENPAFDCTLLTSGENPTRLLYGQDTDDVIHYVSILDNTSVNSEDTGVRGIQVRVMQVVYVKYFEANNNGVRERYLDLSYSQATVYSGQDDSFSTSDDILFKSRTRLVGQVDFDADGNILAGKGDFSVIKFDEGVDQGLNPYSTTNQALGRGNYAEGGYMIFNFQSTRTELSDNDGNFCLENDSSFTVPIFAETQNCSVYEENFAWEGINLPSGFTEDLEEVFENNNFFTSDALIESDGSNFIIPTYETLSE